MVAIDFKWNLIILIFLHQTKNGLPGQWIRYKSRYEVSRFCKDFSMANRHFSEPWSRGASFEVRNKSSRYKKAEWGELEYTVQKLLCPKSGSGANPIKEIETELRYCCSLIVSRVVESFYWNLKSQHLNIKQNKLVTILNLRPGHSDTITRWKLYQVLSKMSSHFQINLWVDVESLQRVRDESFVSVDSGRVDGLVAAHADSRSNGNVDVTFATDFERP